MLVRCGLPRVLQMVPQMMGGACGSAQSAGMAITVLLPLLMSRGCCQMQMSPCKQLVCLVQEQQPHQQRPTPKQLLLMSQDLLLERQSLLHP